MTATADFKTCAETVRDATKFTSQPSDAEKLDMYAIFKQATDGDVSGERPGMLSLKERAKYDAWAKLKGTSKADAEQKYVQFFNDNLKARMK